MIFHRSYPIQIQCDAPCYPIVQACRTIGMQAPEDVRWCRIDHLSQRLTSLLELFRFRIWRTLLRLRMWSSSTCPCGQELPKLERYTFTFISGAEAHYLLGQCSRCHTVYWKQA
jgi:hypothetical protein